jgi:hypothetical protein
MQRTRLVELIGPVALSLAVLAGVGALRAMSVPSTAHAEPQSLSIPPGYQPNLGDPPSFLNAGSQRVEQLDVMREVLGELRAIRKLLQDGGARVRVDSVALDYDRLADSVVRAMPAANAGASNGRVGSTGTVRRLTDAEAGGEGSND